jgi:hypothetical protein
VKVHLLDGSDVVEPLGIDVDIEVSTLPGRVLRVTQRRGGIELRIFTTGMLGATFSDESGPRPEHVAYVTANGVTVAK